MGFQDSKAPHHHRNPRLAAARGAGEMDDDRWVIAGIPLRAPLKPISTNPLDSICMDRPGEISDGDQDRSTTPTGEGSRIPTNVSFPPPPPRKRKPSLKFRHGGEGREFFTPPGDLESVFIRRAGITSL